MASTTAFILSSHDRGALALCRALSQSGCKTSIIRLSPQKSFADYSRFCSESIFFGVPGAAITRFCAHLTNLIDARRPDFLIPIGDFAETLASYDFSAITRLTQLVGPEPVARATSRNLIEARRIAEKLGIACPEGLFVRRDSAFTFEAPLPCMFRPIVPSAIIDDEWQRFSERAVRTASELADKLRDDHPRTDILLQAPVTGEKLSLHGFARQGRLLAGAMTSQPQRSRFRFFAHLQAKQMTPPFQELMHEAMRELAWTGFLSMTLIRQHDHILFDKFDSGSETAVEAIVSRTFGLAGLMFEGSTASDALVVGDQRLRNHFDDFRSGVLTDALPSAMRLLPLVARARRTLVRRLTPMLGALRPAFAPPGPIRKSERLLIVCQGNINRSVVAEHLFRARGCSNVVSAALLSMSGRRASAHAEQFLRTQLDADMSAFRSQSIDHALEQQQPPELVVCFEQWQAQDLARRVPELSGKIYLLTQLVENQNEHMDIADPHGLSDETYRRCFERIDELISRVPLTEDAKRT